MRGSSRFAIFAAGLLAAASVYAQAPSGAPAGTTGLCKDGSYYAGATKKGACRGHKGVRDWYAGDAAAVPAAAPAAPIAGATTKPSSKASAATAVAAPAAVAVTAPAAPAAAAPHYMPPAVAAAGGGAGQVWGNKSSKVYHCSNDKWYGKTKGGEYMTEAAALAAGYHADHGHACK